MAPPKVKLVYFHGRGRAEIVRWVLAAANVEWEDERISFDDWPALKPKTPSGTLPYAEIDGKPLGCSGAISIYLGRKLGFLGSNDWDEANIMMIVEVVNDALNALVKAIYCKDETLQKEFYKTYGEKNLPGLLNLLTKTLEGGKQWLIGGKLSLADISVGLFLDMQKAPYDEAVKAQPSVAALVQRVKELPGIKKWIAERPESTF